MVVVAVALVVVAWLLMERWMSGAVESGSGVEGLTSAGGSGRPAEQPLRCPSLAPAPGSRRRRRIRRAGLAGIVLLLLRPPRRRFCWCRSHRHLIP